MKEVVCSRMNRTLGRVVQTVLEMAQRSPRHADKTSPFVGYRSTTEQVTRSRFVELALTIPLLVYPEIHSPCPKSFIHTELYTAQTTIVTFQSMILLFDAERFLCSFVSNLCAVLFKEELFSRISKVTYNKMPRICCT